MKTSTIVTIVAIVAALGSITSLIPIHQVSAVTATANPNGHALNPGTANALTHTGNQQPPFRHTC